MGIKDFFFVKEDGDKTNETEIVQQPNTPQFPTSMTLGQSTPQVQTPTYTNNSDMYVNTFIEVYTKKFEELNQNGFDFFEFFKAVSAANMHNETGYQMAMTMGKTMSPTLNKAALLSQADNYKFEIENHFRLLDQEAVSKIDQLNKEINNTTASLNETIRQNDLIIEQKRAELQRLIDDNNANKAKLPQIMETFQPKLSELTAKKGANQMAKDSVIRDIDSVKRNIDLYIK